MPVAAINVREIIYSLQSTAKYNGIAIVFATGEYGLDYFHDATDDENTILAGGALKIRNYYTKIRKLKYLVADSIEDVVQRININSPGNQSIIDGNRIFTDEIRGAYVYIFAIPEIAQVIFAELVPNPA